MREAAGARTSSTRPAAASPGNMGPDVIVRTDLGQSVQNAVDAVTDANSDGYLIVAVVNNGSGQLGGSSTQSVVISQKLREDVRADRLQRDAERPDAWRRQSDDLDQSSANSPGNIFLMDLHGAGSSAAGILVNGNGRYLRNEYGLRSGVGFKVLGNGNTIHNGQGTDNTGDGVYVQGEANILTDVDAFSNDGNGFHVVGNNNQLLKLDAGDKSKGNTGDGIHLVGNGNLVSEPERVRQRAATASTSPARATRSRRPSPATAARATAKTGSASPAPGTTSTRARRAVTAETGTT